MSYLKLEETGLEVWPVFGKADKVKLWGESQWEVPFRKLILWVANVLNSAHDPLIKLMELFLLNAKLHESTIEVIDLFWAESKNTKTLR